MEKLTLKEAIKQGYTKYGFANREWQTTNDLHDDIFKEVEEEDWDDLVLFGKEISQPTISEETIRDMLAEHIAEDDSMECGRDDDCVYNTVKEMDFSDITEKINNELKQHEYWMLTDIYIIPNE